MQIQMTFGLTAEVIIALVILGTAFEIERQCQRQMTTPLIYNQEKWQLW